MHPLLTLIPAPSTSASRSAIRSDPAPSPSAPGRRLEFLDALRGIAATYVVLYHMANIPHPHLPVPVWAARVVGAGGSGVTLFFVVSAFSLFYTMPLRQRDASPTLSFYVHRLFRIAPLFYLWIILTLVRDAWLLGVRHAPTEVAASLAFVFNLIPGWQEGFVWASWTIGIEMIFYLVFPLAYRVVRNAAAALMLALGCWLTWTAYEYVAARLPFPALSAVATKWLFLRHLPIFAVGAVCYFVVRDRAASLPDSSRSRYGTVLIAIALLLYVALLSGWLQARSVDAYYWAGSMYGCLLVGLALRPIPGLVNRLTRFLGTISYSVYLNHPTLVLLLTPLYRRLYLHGPSVGVAFTASLAVTFALLIPLSWATYRFVEEPGVRLARRLIATHRPASVAAPLAAT